MYVPLAPAELDLEDDLRVCQLAQRGNYTQKKKKRKIILEDTESLKSICELEIDCERSCLRSEIRAENKSVIGFAFHTYPPRHC